MKTTSLKKISLILIIIDESDGKRFNPEIKISFSELHEEIKNKNDKMNL